MASARKWLAQPNTCGTRLNVDTFAVEMGASKITDLQDNFSDPIGRQDQNRRISEIEEYLEGIGLAELAEKVRLNHFASRAAELERTSDHYAMSVHLAQMKEDRLVDDLKVINAEFTKTAVNYNNVIAGLGYAGFLGVLNFCRDLIFPLDLIFILLLFSLSLMVFVFWTATLGVLQARAVSRVSPLFDLSEDQYDRLEIIEKFNGASARYQVEMARSQKFWAPTFLFSLVTGLLSAIFLWAALIYQIFRPHTSLFRLIFDYFFCSSCTTI